jgi:hypothetical protein
MEESNRLLRRLREAGYSSFIVWDDAGFPLLSTSSLDVLMDLNRYLLRVALNRGHISIYNYDVLCVHAADEDVFRAVDTWFRALGEGAVSAPAESSHSR